MDLSSYVRHIEFRSPRCDSVQICSFYRNSDAQPGHCLSGGFRTVYGSDFASRYGPTTHWRWIYGTVGTGLVWYRSSDPTIL